MRSVRTVHVISAHAEGEVGDVIVGGVLPPPGDTIWEQSRFIARDKSLRNFVLNEPRGGVFRHVNLLVPPKHPQAQAAFIIMEPEDTPPMSGSNAICVATVLLETGLVEMREPVTEFVIEAPGLPPRGAESYTSHPGAQVGTTQTMRPITDEMLADARAQRQASRMEPGSERGGGMLWLIAAAVLIMAGLSALLLYAPGWLD